MLNRFVLMLFLMLDGCSAAAPPLAGARIGGPFTLTGPYGQTITDRDFNGSYRIVYFGYTSCPDVCPTDVANLAHGWQAFGKGDPARAARIKMTFITVDPARDTPAVLKSWTAAFDPRIIGLTGTPAAIAAVAKAYGVAFSAEPVNAAGGYVVDHTSVTYLMAPDGAPIALLPNDGTPNQIAAVLNQWVR